MTVVLTMEDLRSGPCRPPAAHDRRRRQPSRIEQQTPDLLERTRDDAARLGVPGRLHARQSHLEVARVREMYDARPVQVLDRLGLLGPRLLVPHAGAVDGHNELDPGSGEDVRRLADTGTTVVFCPLASGRYGMVPGLDVLVPPSFPLRAP